MTPERTPLSEEEYWERYGAMVASEKDNPRCIRVHGRFIWDNTGQNWLSIDSGWHNVKFTDGRELRTKALSHPKEIKERLFKTSELE